MIVRTGTSGFSYKEWKGDFYPADLSNDRMLAYYAARLPAVEINNTFYRLPKPGVIDNWAAQVPEDFRFALKASRRITHFGKLKGVEEPTEYLLSTATRLGERLGVVLFQLPPYLRKGPERLSDFLDRLPDDGRYAFEFRHDTWRDAEIYGLLRERNCALVIADTDDAAATVEATADWGYLRLRRTAYSDADLVRWAERIGELGWQEAFVFFKHEDECAGPAMAARFLELTTA